MDARHGSADGFPFPTPPPLALARELIRRVTVDGEGAKLRLPAEVRAHLSVSPGDHVLFCLRDRGTVELVSLARVGVELLPMIEESEILGGLRRQVFRLRRRLDGARRAGHATGCIDGYTRALAEWFRADHGQAPAAPPGTRVDPAGGTADPPPSPPGSPSASRA